MGELRVEPDDSREADGIKIYHIDGPVFFTTANKLIKIFDVDNDPEHVEVIFGYASLMDFTAISTLHKVACNYRAKEKNITYKCLNVSSQNIVAKANALLAGTVFEGAEAKASAAESNAPSAKGKEDTTNQGPTADMV